MKPNDKAYQEAADEIRFNSGLDLSEDVCSELAKIAVDAAYAAQFKCEDYAELVKRLRSQNELYVERYIGTNDLDENKVEILCNEAADAIEALLAKLNDKPKPSED